MTKVVAGIIWNDDGQILIGKRGPQQGHLAGKWEFPGGKVESGETPEQALSREITEEIGIAINELAAFEELTWAYSGHPIHLIALSAKWAGGEPQALEHDELVWVLPELLSLYDFAPADWGLVFSLDPHYQITAQEKSSPSPEPHS
ncbi:MAG: 8-oxo-dGTP diphosphatase MutT [Bdellovibrionaceae bacterium]|nr:8-oxo-dGTP diphosphatase MutT [Bdellovibrionales bacterium]MCB9085079.1 8-oxo-dGTP diphosphatase MutT [Pseudobdellovibrionaceae bacterium]